MPAILPAGFFVVNLDSKTIALSKKRKVLSLIKKIEHTNQQDKIFKNFIDKNFMNIYLSGNYLEYLNSKSDPLFSLILNNLNLDHKQLAWANLKVIDNKMVYNFLSESLDKQNFKKFKNKDKEFLDNLVNQNDFIAFASANLK